LQDPAGLDDGFSVDGGNLLSARDLAIIARAALSQPLIAQVVGTPVYRFTGPDGVHHRLGNHNELLKTYAGAIGMKTGYTAKSGEDLIAAAQRDGRTMIAVVMGAPNLWRDAGRLLDEGFAAPPGAAGTGDVLPGVHLPGMSPAPSDIHTAAVAPSPVRAAVTPVHHGTSGTPAELVIVLGVGATAVGVAVRRRQIVVRRRRRLRQQARLRKASRDAARRQAHLAGSG
jgi:D-alanyl-D-alanine carboxypeptidase